MVRNFDQPGHVADVTRLLAEEQVNIASMHISRDVRGGYAVMVIETDHPIPEPLLKNLRTLDGILQVTCINLSREEK